jgi:hypothetical protein
MADVATVSQRLIADAGKCADGHPLGMWELKTVLGLDARPVQVWIAECRALTLTHSRAGITNAVPCAGRAWMPADDLVLESAPWMTAAVPDA